MSHEISRTDESFARYAVVPAWHGLGKVASASEAESTELFCLGDDMIPDVVKIPAAPIETPDGICEVPNHYHLWRKGYGVVSDSTVSSRYGALADSAVVEMLRPWVDGGYARWDSRFLLSHGRDSVFALRLNNVGDLTDTGSKYATYLTVLNPQGGTGNCKGKVTAVRVVCRNTVRAAFSTGFDWSIRHVGDTSAKLKLVREKWEQAAKAVSEAQEAIRRLESKTLNVPQTIDALLGIDDDSSTQARNLALNLKAKANDSTVGTYGRSALDIYNAVTDYATRPTSGGKSPERNFSGTMQSFEADMFGKLLSLAS